VFLCIGSRARGPVTILLSALDRAALAHSGRDAQSGQQPPLKEKPRRAHDHKKPQIIHYYSPWSICSGPLRSRIRLSGNVPVDERRKFVLCRAASSSFEEVLLTLDEYEVLSVESFPSKISDKTAIKSIL
jgi:hypothetical protein